MNIYGCLDLLSIFRFIDYRISTMLKKCHFKKGVECSSAAVSTNIKLPLFPGRSEGRRYGGTQPFLSEHKRHVLSDAAPEPRADPRHPGIRHRSAVL